MTMSDRSRRHDGRNAVGRRCLAGAIVIALFVPATAVVLVQSASAAGGDIYTIAGTGTGSYNGDGIPATSAALEGPVGLTLDPEGNRLVADLGNSRVRVLAVSASNPGYPLAGCSGTCSWNKGDIYTIAGTGSPGYSGDGGSATGAEMDFPSGVGVDGGGNVLIADSGNNRVRVLAVSASNPGYPLAGCSGACTWAAGDIYTVAGTGTAGYNGDGGSATSAELNGPTGVLVAGGGNILIADSSNSRVRVLAVSASNPGYPLAGCSGACTWASSDIYTVAGIGGGYGGDGGSATSAELNDPAGMSADAEGNLLIADTFNDRVRVVAVSASNPGYPLAGCSGTCTWAAGDIYTVAGTGTAGYNGDGGSSTSADLNNPFGIGMDGQGDLIVADSGNSRVRMLAVSASNPGYPLAGCSGTCTWAAGDIYTVAGTGSAGYNGDGGSSTSTELNDPTAVVVDAHANLDIADFAGERIREIVAPGAPAAPTSVEAVSGSTTTSTGSLTVTYTLGADNGDAITTQTATCTSTNGGVPKTGTINGSAAAPITVSGVTARKTYRCRVAATNLLGTGPSSAASPAVIVGTPTPPTGVKATSEATSASTGSLMVTYRAAAANGSPIGRYTARCASSNFGVTKTGIHYYSTVAPIVVKGVTTGKTYTCTVTATNSRGASPASVPSAPVTVGAPAAPTQITASRVASGRIKVSFKAGANNGSPITGFLVTCASSNGGGSVQRPGRASPITVTGLIAGDTYTCVVAAQNARGSGLPSNSSRPVTA